MQFSGSHFPRMTAAETAAKVGGTLEGKVSLPVTGLSSIEEAKPGDAVFIRNEKYAPLWTSCRAKVVLVARGVASRLPPRPGTAVIAVDDADLAFAALLKLAEPPLSAAGFPASGIHPSALVDGTAKLGEGVRIGANCVVGPRVEIGARTVLYPGVAVFDDVRIGADCVLWNGVVVRERCVIGDRCVLHVHAVIGADGFGYRPAPDGSGVIKIPHIGGVEIGHDVDIGANTCIDRGKLSATVVGDFCKIDNLCQIGHNSRLGRGVLMAGNVGISGSVDIGDGVMIGGGAGVADHVTIGAGAAIAAAAGVMRDVPPRGKVGGTPARDLKQFFRELTALARLSDKARPQRIVAAGQDPAIAPPPRRTFQQWLDEINRRSAHQIAIRGYDGLGREERERVLRGTPMTEEEFQQKLGRCTFHIKA